MSTYPKPYAGDWSVFNGAGAVICEGVNFEIAADYMTADRFERGWTMVACKVIKTAEDLAILAADRARGVEVETGWKLVPVEATPEMLTSAMKDCGSIGAGSCGEHSGVDWDDMRAVYAAMLAAAPSTPPAAGMGEEAK